MSLRARLTLIVVAVVAVAILALAFVTRTALTTYLDDQVNDQVQTADEVVFGAAGPRGPVRAVAVSGLPTGSYAQLISRTGEYEFIPFAAEDLYQGEFPLVTLSDEFLDQVRAEGSVKRDFTESGDRYRVKATERRDGTIAVVAVPMGSIDDTIQSLNRVLLIVSASVLVACGAAAFLLVSFGLRPLRRMASTADQIAGGDLTARVAPTNNTEIGSLGSSLNTMLDQLARGMAERETANSRLRRFVADASHELRTPLTSIRGYAELFRRGASERPDDLETVMRRIEEESARMGILVDDLLLLARLDQGLPLLHEPVGLAQLVDDAVRDAAVATADHDFSVKHSEPVMAVGDDARLRQVLANLLRNAGVHTPAGTRVWVSLTKEGGEAVIVVADNGPGIPADAQAQIFERFGRVDESRARLTGGTGLGLAIAQSIVVAHGGTIAVGETPGGGATFTVRLPLHA